MTRTKWLALAGCALLSLGRANATAPGAERLERLVFESMLLSPDHEKSRLGARMLGQQFPNDDSWCDVVAERLLKDPPARNATDTDTLSWYVKTLGASCTPRYHDALTLAQQRHLHRKIAEYFEVALANPKNASVPQYVEGAVDPAARQADIERELAEFQRGGPFGFSEVQPGMRVGDVLARAGVPRDFSSQMIRIARWGNGDVLAAHYDGKGMLIFRRDFASNQWKLGDIFEEMHPVSKTYDGDQFAVAQSVACLRGLPFRDYIHFHARSILEDRALLWSLTHRLSHTPFPADDHEEAGMLAMVSYIGKSTEEQAPQMLEEIGSSPGDKVPEAAREHLEARKQRAAKAAAKP